MAGVAREFFNKHRRRILIGVAAVVLVGLAIGELVIWLGLDKTVGSDTACPVLPATTTLTATKVLSARWTWTYEAEQYGLTIEKRCPTVRADGLLMSGDDMVSQTDTVALSLLDQTSIQDCHGDEIVFMEVGSFTEQLLQNIEVSMRLYNRDGGDLLGYVTGNGYLTDDVQVVDMPTGAVVATARRETVTLSRWKWELQVLNATSPVGDMRILAGIAARRSFGGEDVCNEYFRYVGFLLLAIVCAVALAACCYGGKKYHTYKQTRQIGQHGVQMADIN